MAWIEECLGCLNKVAVRKDFGAEADAELEKRGWHKVKGQGWLCPACTEALLEKGAARQARLPDQF